MPLCNFVQVVQLHHFAEEAIAGDACFLFEIACAGEREFSDCAERTQIGCKALNEAGVFVGFFAAEFVVRV